MTAVGRVFQIAFILLMLSVAAACNQASDHQSSAGSEADGVNQTINKSAKHVLIFSKTQGYRHPSIEQASSLLSEALSEQDIRTTVTEDASVFTDSSLRDFSALIFLNTTGDVLDDKQQLAMESYIQAGGGFVGIHAASDTEHQGDWYWYRRLVGGVFAGHPSTPSNVQTATINVENAQHLSTQGLPESFSITDEWYDFSHLSESRIDLLSVDESSYQGGGHGGYHPIAWYMEFDGGRSFYTGIGHVAENYQNPVFMAHLLGGIEYAIGENERPLYQTTNKLKPKANRFTKQTLVSGLNEPVSMDISKSSESIIIVERKGAVKWYNTVSETLTQIGSIPVHSAEGFGEFGLLAVALDPNFEDNQHIYLMFNTAYDAAIALANTAVTQDIAPSRAQAQRRGPLQRVSRFTLRDGRIDMDTEVVLLDFPNDDSCCHTGGAIEFDGKGNLFIATGDNTNPFASFGVGPTDFRESEFASDALRSSGNTQDLRGKILRITPQADGSYSIPQGNLFANAQEGRPEIYVMGTRNPYTISIDKQTGTLYYGDVGPDARSETPEYGAKGHDEINRVTQAGNFGWPMFIGDNKPYREYDFSTEVSGDLHNPDAPKNTSPNNTGATDLPPAQKALIWYPYGNSPEFPEMETGPRNALVAGVYPSRTQSDEASLAYPEYYDGALFISDFVRRYIKVVFTRENGKLEKIDDFAPDVELFAPLDLAISNKGELFVLEYGAKWHANNPDAGLSKIVFDDAENRQPSARISMATNKGASPFIVEASAQSSVDPDDDKLTYAWQIVALNDRQEPDEADYSKAQSVEGIDLQTTLNQNGRYGLKLTITDTGSLTHSSTQLLEIGNSPPRIDLQVDSLNQFIWPGQPAPRYAVSIFDKEDGLIDDESPFLVDANIRYEKVETRRQEEVLGHQLASPLELGRKAAEKHACLACHQEQSESVGPAFSMVADKYADRTDAAAYLNASIAAGGSGRWGQHNMPAFDYLDDKELSTLSQYILALKSPPPSLAKTGTLPLSTESGSFELRATYQDQGADGLSRIQTSRSLTMRSPTLELAQFVSHKGEKNGVRAREAINLSTVAMYGAGTSLYIGEYDFSELSGVTLSQLYWWRLSNDISVELRLDSPTGPLLTSGKFDHAGVEQDDRISLDLAFPSVVGVAQEASEPAEQAIDNSSFAERLFQQANKRKLFIVTSGEDAEEDALALHLRDITFKRK